MRPVCQILIDGAPASGLFMDRMISCTVTDNEGVSADMVEIELDDNPPAALPRRGAVLSISMGYATGVAFMGEFLAEEIEARALPYSLRITGKSADMGGKEKGQKERHWDDVTLGELIKEIAADHDLASSVDPALASFVYPWIGQIGESDIAFLERLADRHGAIFAIKKRTVIFAQRGAAVSPTGAALTASILTPSVIAPGSCSFTLSERSKYAEVISVYMDRASGERREVTVEADPEGEGAFTIDQPYASQAEARSAATARARELQRRALNFGTQIIGDPTIRGGAPVVFAGVRPGLDGTEFIVETATHAFSKAGGYTTTLTGKLKV
jgi:phage protein D